MKEIFIRAVLAVLFLGFGRGDNHLFSQETRIYVFGLGNFYQASGSNSDYKPGENDFPLTAAHQNCGPGIRLTAGTPVFFLGLEGQYQFSGRVFLTDPSDGDEVSIRSYPYLAGYVLAGANLVRSSLFKIYILAGGGVYKAINAETRRYTSDFGYETLIEPPDSKTPFAGFGGLGISFRLSSRARFFGEGRYQYVDADQAQTLISFLAGVSLDL